jgi:uncharacterized membrane protein YhaH (DUF805 family)
MGFGEAISHNFNNITNFEGRAARPEFWWWILAVWIINIIIAAVTGTFTGNTGSFLSIIGTIISIILVLATLAVGSRRLHDTGKSGWLQLLYLIPCVGWIVVFILCAQPGTPGDNPYGPAPTA